MAGYWYDEMTAEEQKELDNSMDILEEEWLMEEAAAMESERNFDYFYEF